MNCLKKKRKLANEDRKTNLKQMVFLHSPPIRLEMYRQERYVQVVRVVKNSHCQGLRERGSGGTL